MSSASEGFRTTPELVAEGKGVSPPIAVPAPSEISVPSPLKPPSATQPSGPVQPGLQGQPMAPAVPVNPLASAFTDSMTDYGFNPESQGYILETLDGKVLAENNADQPMNPASVTKVCTSLAVISQLGPDFRFRTMIYTDGYLEPATGILHGSLYVMGSGDPAFLTENAMLIADQLGRHGIRSVDGNLVVEGQFYFNFSDSHDASAKAFRAALMTDLSKAKDSAAYQRFLGMRAADLERSRITFAEAKSAVPPSSGQPAVASSNGAAEKGAEHSAVPEMKQQPAPAIPYLKISGETVVQPGISTTNLKLLAVHTSLPLVRVLKGQNDFSNNWMATVIGNLVGGPAAVDRFLEHSIGLRPDEIRLMT
ncbi:MAG TPA: D-alanyl-D-alanine carboxypeptidase, partial [Blastocatellia bacterium]|nr:D-alanyl-D-alanine carboxypeptidase [Blastocatellia bacterium]